MLKFANEALRNDEEAVLAAVGKHGCAVQFASEALQNSKAFALRAVKRNWDAFHFLLTAFQLDTDVAMEAVKQNPHLLGYLQAPARTDPDVLRAAGSSGLRPEEPWEPLQGLGLVQGPGSDASLDWTRMLEHTRRDPRRHFPNVGEGLRASEDFVLLAARVCRHRTDVDAKFFHAQAAERVRGLVSAGRFELLVGYPLAVTGQEAHTLHPGLACCEDPSYGTHFYCQVHLDCGVIIKCEVIEHYLGGYPARLIDLAVKLRQQLWMRQREIGEDIVHFFLRFRGEPRPCRVWDWQRPLADFSVKCFADPQPGCRYNNKNNNNPNNNNNNNNRNRGLGLGLAAPGAVAGA